MRNSVAILFLFLTASFSRVNAQPNGSSPVRLSEAYELGNVVLALTNYGKTDPWEVEQRSDYYRRVRAHFDKFSSHPLLVEVNYSRAKWESYLSFRTDAYAFVFDDDNRLVRATEFYANDGFNEFEAHLDLISDFVEATGFRQF